MRNASAGGPRKLHRDTVERYRGTLAELAADIADLKYDALALFLNALADKLAADAEADRGRGRAKLAGALSAGSAKVKEAAADIERAWAVAAPHMAQGG